MSEHTLDIEHDGQRYSVMIDADWAMVDDSFDGHLGGYVHTFEAHHWEVEDYRVIECLLIGEDDDEEIDADDVPGLSDAIDDTVKEMTRDE
jgi:hypothetical protein